MKKTNLIVTSLVALTVAGLGGSSALADTAETNGKVEYEKGSLTIDPDPDPDPDPGENGGFGAGLPKNLNFGKHAIQNAKEETWIATLSGTKNTVSENPDDITKGELAVNDGRGSSLGWTIKAVQSTQFAGVKDSKELVGAVLKITPGKVKNNGGVLPSVSLKSQTSFSPGTEQTVFGAKVNEGAGRSSMELSQFELDVPATAIKNVQVYNSAITWTLSDTPA